MSAYTVRTHMQRRVPRRIRRFTVLRAVLIIALAAALAFLLGQIG